MKVRRSALSVATSLLLPLVFAAPSAAQGPGNQPVVVRSLAERIVKADPARYNRQTNVHGGAGPMAYQGLFGSNVIQSNLYFLHRGIIEPGGGIGHHFHNATEEMFVILSEGEAEFTINGRTSRIRTPAGVPTVMGSSHAIRNPTGEPLEWMNINISAIKGVYDAFDLGDPRVDVPLDPIPVFMVMDLKHSTLRAANAVNGGEGPAQYARRLAPTVFRSTWSYVDQLVLPPGSSQGLHRHTGVEEFYYVISGTGTMTVNGETAQVTKDSAIPIHLNEVHGIRNTGTEPLELMIVGIATSMEKNLETVQVTQ